MLNLNCFKMRNSKTEIKYKSETGKTAYNEIETKHLTRSMDGVEFIGMTGKEICDTLAFDYNNNANWGIFISELPNKYIFQGDVKIYSPEYVEWLENQIKID